jgi:hypothetical protein
MPPTGAVFRVAYYGLERRVPASLLLITPDIGIANSVYGTLEHALGARIWLWHEPALEPAVRVLGVCRFRVVLLDMKLVEAAPEWTLPSLKQAAPETPLVMLGTAADPPSGTKQGRPGTTRSHLSGAMAVVPPDDLASLTHVVLQVVGIPAATGDSESVEPA